MNKIDEIRQAYLQSSLRVKSVDPDTGEVVLAHIAKVMCHEVAHKQQFKIQCGPHEVIATEDHSLFSYANDHITEIHTRDLKVGDFLAAVDSEDRVVGFEITAIETIEALPVMYDLAVPGPENFVLSNGMLAHNSYSIGGISLDIDRSSKYQSMKDNAEQQFEKAYLEGKRNTVKFIRGLQQPRFGQGVRSSFGPSVGRGVLSPRSFV